MREQNATTTHAPTLTIKSGDVSYAYRDLGSQTGVPLLCLQHFTGTLDNWDPAVFDALSQERRVILFGNAGVGRSTGTVAAAVSEMSDHVIAFLEALGLRQVDLLGFSLGGFLAQDIALRRPELLRRIVLAGTGPEGGEGVSMNRPELLAIFSHTQMLMTDKLRTLFFPANDRAQQAAEAYIQRIKGRTADRDTAASAQVAMAQLQAMAGWENAGAQALTKLRGITHPVLVVNGDNDIMIPTSNSRTLAELIPDATLILYPNAGHGAIYQHGKLFTEHVRAFLNL